MKKLIFTLLLVMAAVAGASAQKFDIYAAYGGYTQMDVMDMHDSWAGVNTAWGGVTLGGDVAVTRNLWIGPSLTISSTSTHGPEASHINYFVLMANLRYHFYRNSIVSVYGHGAMGADISHMMPRHGNTYNKAYFAFQVGFGAQVNLSRGFGIYGELGFGAQGLVQVGMRYGF